MSNLQWSGCIALGMSVLYVLDIVRRRGPRFEYASAMFFGELGLLNVVTPLIPSELGQVFVTCMFGLSMIATAVVWVKLFRRFNRGEDPYRPDR